MLPGRDSCYQRNIEALRIRQPELAARIDDTSIPSNVVETTGRDGSRTYRLPDPDGRLTWFGRTSMPTVSATECVERFLGGAGNVVVPGVLSGCEVQRLLERLAPRVAVFVLEDQPLSVRLALSLYDYSQAISSGHLVLARESEVAGDLVQVFRTEPGYEFPARLFTPPQRDAAQIADLQRTLGAIGREVHQIQAQALQELKDRIAQRERPARPAAPRVALIATDAEQGTLEHVYRMGRALEALNWPFEPCAPDNPRKCHLVAQLAAIDRVEADLVLLVNSPPGVLASLLPPSIRVASWYLSAASLPENLAPAFSEGCPVWAASATIRQALELRQASPEYINMLPPGADTVLFRPVDIAEEEVASVGCEVAVLADLPPTSPQAVNISLPSHVELWQALRAALTRRINGTGYTSDQAERVLSEAERASGTAVKDPAIREHFIQLFRWHLLPAILARSAAEALLEEGHRIGVWGTNWEALPGDVDVRRGPIPQGEALNRLFNAVDTVLLPVPSVESTQMALNALAAGANVICRSPERALEEEYPGLGDLSSCFNLYRNRDELRETLARLRSRVGNDLPRRRREGLQSAVDHHKLEHRLTTLWRKAR